MDYIRMNAKNDDQTSQAGPFTFDPPLPNVEPVPYAEQQKILQMIIVVLACTGMVFNCMHTCVLVFLIRVRKLNGYTYILILSVTCLITDILIIPIALYWEREVDYNIESKVVAELYAKPAQFLLNALRSTIAYQMLLICADRYFALHNPVLYARYSKRKYRLSGTFIAFALGAIFSTPWFVQYEVITLDGSQIANMHGLHYFVRQTKLAQNSYILCLQIVLLTVQFILPFGTIIWISMKNVHKARWLSQLYSGPLRSNHRFSWIYQQEVMVRMSIAQVVLYSFAYLPMCVLDLVELIELLVKGHVGSLHILVDGYIVNLAQTVMIQINFLIFASFTQQYRLAIKKLWMWSLWQAYRIVCGPMRASIIELKASETEERSTSKKQRPISYIGREIDFESNINLGASVRRPKRPTTFSGFDSGRASGSYAVLLRVLSISGTRSAHNRFVSLDNSSVTSDAPYSEHSTPEPKKNQKPILRSAFKRRKVFRNQTSEFDVDVHFSDIQPGTQFTYPAENGCSISIADFEQQNGTTSSPKTANGEQANPISPRSKRNTVSFLIDEDIDGFRGRTRTQ